MIWGRLAWGGGCIPRGPGGAEDAWAPGTTQASLSGCSGPLGSASWLMGAASTMRGETHPGSRRGNAREGRSQGTGALWPGSPCLVPLSFSVARGGDERGGEEAVPAAPPPPPPAAPAQPAVPSGGGGQGASPGPRELLGGQGPLDAGVAGEAQPANSRLSDLGESAARATRHLAPSGPEPGAPQRSPRREKAKRTPASGPPPRSRFSRE